MFQSKREKNTKKEIDEDYVSKNAQNITEEDFKKVSEKADEIESKFEKGGPLGRFINDAKLLLSITKDYYKGNYRNIPYLSISAIVFALLYVFNPFDIVPDAIPVIGLSDDAAVVAACLTMVEQDLHEYKEWRAEQTDRQLEA